MFKHTSHYISEISWFLFKGTHLSDFEGVIIIVSDDDDRRLVRPQIGPRSVNRLALYLRKPHGFRA
jgi:hypothetical protein